jgi:hypothetical protein
MAKSRTEGILSTGINPLKPRELLTNVWRTELGTILFIGLNGTSAIWPAYFRCLQRPLDCDNFAVAPSQFLLRMASPRRVRPF